MISHLYGYSDYGVELLIKAKNIFEEGDYAWLIKELKRDIKLAQKVPSFKGKGFIYKAIKNFANIFLSPYKGAYHSDCELGNRRIG